MGQKFNLAAHCLAENARKNPGKTALILTNGATAQEFSYAELELATQKLAAGFLSLGLQPGDRVLIRRGNDQNYLLSFFALIAAGLVALPSSTQLTAEEARYLAQNSGAAAVIAGPGHKLDGQDLHGDELDGVRNIDDAELERLKNFPPAAFADTSAEDPAFLIYTSGTTNHPKGVLHAQRVILGRAPMLDHWLGLREQDVMLHAGAINWTFTLGVGVMDPFARGASSVLYNGPADPKIWPKLIARHGATIFAAVPGIYRQMLRDENFSAQDFASLRHGVVAGEALAASLLADFTTKTGKPLYEALGMSEISTYISSGPTIPVCPGSPGKAQPGRHIAILPLEGGDDPLPIGETGLLAVRRDDPGLMLGYWRDAEAENEVFRGNWFCGGDVAELDAQNYVWLHGRANDLMNAGGYRVSPAEVEACLSQAAGVADVAVAERLVRENVSIICAFIVVAPGAALDDEALRAHCAGHLAAYKNPKKYIAIESLPRTKNGKVARRLLPEFFTPVQI